MDLEYALGNVRKKLESELKREKEKKKDSRKGKGNTEKGDEKSGVKRKIRKKGDIALNGRVEKRARRRREVCKRDTDRRKRRCRRRNL